MQAGGNFIDTADVYQFGVSESIIGNWLVQHPELRAKMIIATKVCPGEEWLEIILCKSKAVCFEGLLNTHSSEKSTPLERLCFVQFELDGIGLCILIILL